MPEEVKVPLVKLRARYVGQPTDEEKIKGYFNNVFYDIWVKQDGIKMYVKRADERTQGESRLNYNNFDEFTEKWTIGFKYIDNKHIPALPKTQ